MATFILIHGGCHGGWCWERVVPLLKAAGHKAIAPNLPGMGGDPTPLDTVTVASTAEAIATLVSQQSEPVILAGHSMGGVTLSETAERVPDRLLGLVYVSAMLVPNGVTQDACGNPEMIETGRGAIPSADGKSVTYDPKIAVDVFYNTTPPAEVERALARLTPQATAPLFEPVTVSPERFGRVPRAYIECTEDHAIPIAVQRRMQAALPCDPVYTMSTDHSPFLSAPDELSRYLIAAATAFEEAAK